MSCNITQGITGNCNTGIGGVKTVWLANWPYVTAWYEYEMDKGTANLVETYNVNQAGSILGFTQTLTMQLNKMSADKQAEIAKIANQNRLLVRVQLNDDSVLQFGYNGQNQNAKWIEAFPYSPGAYLASGTTTTGVAYTDTNQSELVIQGHTKESMVGATMYLTGGSGPNLGGCFSTQGSGAAGGQLSTTSWDPNTDFGYLTPNPTGSFYQKFYWPQDVGPNFRYRVELTITGAYTANAFDAQGNSQVTFQLGGPWQYPPGGGINFGLMRIINEPTQADVGVVKTFKCIGDFTPSRSTSYNIFSAGTTQLCSATSPGADRQFIGSYTVDAKITRIA